METEKNIQKSINKAGHNLIAIGNIIILLIVLTFIGVTIQVLGVIAGENPNPIVLVIWGLMEVFGLVSIVNHLRQAGKALID